MKKYLKIAIFVFSTFLIASCSKGDVFTGSPVDTNISFETLAGTVATAETNVVTSQKILVTATIPKTFDVDVKVQVTAFLVDNAKKSTGFIVIPAGQTTASGYIKMPSGDFHTKLPYNMTVNLYLSAITTADSVIPTGFLGKQYSITSNSITLDIGDNVLADVDDTKCTIIFDYDYMKKGYPLATTYNIFNVKLVDATTSTVYQPTLPTSTAAYTTTAGISGFFNYNPYYNSNSVIFTNTTAVPVADHTYILSVYPTILRSTTQDVRYRFQITFPDGKDKVIYGVMSNLVVGSSSTAINKLSIVKTTDASGAKYTVTPL